MGYARNCDGVALHPRQYVDQIQYGTAMKSIFVLLAYCYLSLSLKLVKTLVINQLNSTWPFQFYLIFITFIVKYII